MPKKEKKSKKPNTRRKSPREQDVAKEDDALLSAFSDDYNDFFVDEAQKKEDQRAEERAVQKTAQRNKPITPARRKIRRILSYVAIITVVIVVGVVLSLTVLFKTKAYEVTGNTLYQESDIIDTCGIPEGTNIFLAQKNAAAERIKDSFPYFEDVKVGFKIPDTIKIEVTQAVEGYLIKVTDTEYLLISTKGRILNRIADKSRYDLPIFIGPKLISGEIGDYVKFEDKTIVDIIREITQVFADNGFTGITEIDATNTAAISFTYDSRIKVKLGIPEDLSYKIRTAMAIITSKLDVNAASKTRGTLDVSRCNATKRSYFREDESITVAPTTSATGETQAPDDGSGEDEWTDDDWTDDEWTDDEWTDDEWTDDEWTDEWTDDDAYWDGGNYE